MFEINRKPSNFSQFSSGLWMQATDGYALIDFDVYPEFSLEFSTMLVGVIDDCIRIMSEDQKKEIARELLASAKFADSDVTVLSGDSDDATN